MLEIPVEFLKITGVSGLLFLVFYLYHQSTQKQFDTITSNILELLKTTVEQNNAHLKGLEKSQQKLIDIIEKQNN